MKKFLICLLGLLLSIRVSLSQTVICHELTDPGECVTIFMVAKTYIKDTNVTIIYQPYEPLQRGFNGITWKYHKHLYLISLSGFQQNEAERLWALLHEMGHVIDFYSGRLETNPVKWKGKEVDPNLPWDQRPWERSAEKWARKLWKEIMGREPTKIFMEHRAINEDHYKCID